MGHDAAMGSPGLPAMTIDEWADLDEDEPGELVDGRLEEEEVPSYLHEAVVAWLIDTLRGWAVPRGGWVFGSESKFAVASQRGRKSDVSVYFPGAPLPGRRDSVARVPPQIMIEVLSPRPRDGRRDRIDKTRDYADFGVRQYWIVDPELRVLEILELGADGRYAIALTAAEGAHPVPGCEGLTLDLDALWAEIDRLPDGGESPS
jgi:Uma2 family endonuclease